MKARGYWYVRIWEDLLNWISGQKPPNQKRKRKRPTSLR